MQRQSIGLAVWLALSTLTAAAQSLTGVWSADDGGMYYVRQINNQVWWAGLSAISSLGANDIHPGIHFSNVFSGTVSGNTISGDWADVPRGTILQSGTITLIISGNQLKKTAATGGFGAITWTRQNITHSPFDVFNVFDRVRKNNAGGGSLLDNLKPAKAWPVSIFGTLNQSGNAPVVQLAYPPTSGRRYQDFACQEGGGNQDGDIDTDLTVDRGNLDSQFGFWTQGWESDHEITASRFRAKLDADNNRLHLESIMFGGNLNCDDDGAPHFLVPGWQNAGASGVLFNGVPIAGQLSLSPYGDKSAVTAIMGRMLRAGDRIRVNGILVLDCGHSSWWPPEYHPCYEDDSSQHNQEMHPIYSVDVVQDFSHSRRIFANLTGVWAGNDNGTYYVRQLGNTIWWLALSSDEGHSEAHVFHGAFSSGGTSFTGSWADVPLGNLALGGALTINAPQGARSIILSKASGGVFATQWDKLRDVITIPIINQVAERYVHLVLALGQHDPDYVDAFYGPAEWKTQAEKEKKSLDTIGAEAAELSATLAKTPDAAPSGDELLKLRREYLRKQISALSARVRMLKGEKLKFDDESQALYDAVAPTYRQSGSDPDSHFDKIIGQLEKKIPGNGPLWQRYEEWRKPFVIPKEKLDTVFQLAIKECRARTLAHVALPPNESFAVEYVTNKPWGGYNWYKGNFHSVIQVNTDLPTYIDRAVDLAAHEGYPGHHVYNSLLEKNLVRDRGWMEFSVYPLFSPQSLVAEGTANFGREVAFPTKAERMKFEKEVLFPAAGIDASRADEYYAVQDLTKQLDYATNEAARRLINGEIDENAAVQWLQKYAVMEPARAQQRVKFIQRYRSYVINYNLGEDMVRRYIEKRSDADPEKRWSEFGKLLSSPRLPSGLQ